MNIFIAFSPPPAEREIVGWKWTVVSDLCTETGVSPTRAKALEDIVGSISGMCASTLPGAE